MSQCFECGSETGMITILMGPQTGQTICVYCNDTYLCRDIRNMISAEDKPNSKIKNAVGQDTLWRDGLFRNEDYTPEAEPVQPFSGLYESQRNNPDIEALWDKIMSRKMTPY